MSNVNLFVRKFSPKKVRIRFFELAAALCLGLAIHAEAAVRTWTGLGATGNWSTSANWDTGAPANNDSVVFINGTAKFLTTNNFGALTLASITFSGSGGSMNVRGNAITLTGGISASHTGGADSCDIDITLATNNQTIAVTGSGVGSALTMGGDVNLNGRNLTVNVTDSGNVLVMSGAISGTGNITRNTGAGSLWFSGGTPNTYSGITTVNSGLIFATKFAGVISIPGDVVIGNGSATDTLQLNNNDQIAATADISIRNGGVFDLSGNSNTVASVTFVDGGTITTGTGRLQLGGSVTQNGVGTVASITGNLFLGTTTRTFTITNAGSVLTVSAIISGGSSGTFPFIIPAGIIKNGPGVLTLTAANTYGGQMTVDDGTLNANNNLALGGTFALFASAGTVVNNNGALILNNAHVTNEVLTLNSTNPSGALQDNGTADWTGPITLSTDVVIEASSAFGIDGTISGPGGFTMIGGSTLTFRGTNINTYAGTTIVNAGTLQLTRNVFDGSIPGDLIIGDGIGSDVVRNLVQNQIANTSHVTINSSGLFDGNNLVEGIGDLELTGGAVQTGANSLVLFHGGVTANSSSIIATISGNLNLATPVATFDVTSGAASPELLVSAAISGGGITKIGTGNLELAGANNYSGLTTVSNGFIEVASATALGLTNAGTVLESSGSLLIEGVSVVNEPLTNNSASAQVQSTGIAGWSGRVVLNAQLDIATFGGAGTLDLSGVISGSGALTKSQTGTLIYSGSSGNTYTGTTTVNAGTLSLAKSAGGSINGRLVIGDGVGGVNADVVRLSVTSQILLTAPVTVNASGLFDLNNITESFGSLAGSGNVTLGTAICNPGFDGTSTVFSGVISETGSLDKGGGGTMTLTGNNTYTGATIVNEGTLLVNGSQPQSPVSVGASGTLGGIGTVGNIVASGSVAPGSSPGTLTSSNVVFSGSGDYFVDLAGPIAGTDYDQLNVRGTNVLGNAVLHVTPAFTTPVAIGQTFTILNNDLGDAITGTFSGLAEGAGITVNGFSFKISYVGGTGNDVVLTLTNVPLAQAGSSVSLGNGNGTIDPNECNYLNVVITNKTGTPMTGISATLLSTTPNLAVTQPFSAYANVPASGSGTNTVPFQISTSPSFVCGSNVTLNLTVTTSSHGTFTTPIVLTSGGPSAVPNRYDNGVAISIPDVGSIDSTNVVSGFVGPLQKVVVELYLTHTFDSDLTNISLIAPDGTTVLLSSANGGGGQNYGNNCSPDASRTTFDDAAGTAITSGAAPFVGTFRPQSPLSAFIGNGTPNGNWRLHVADGFGGSLGTLRCWSLFLSGTICTPGSGICELCPNVTLTAATGAATPTQTNLLTFTGVASTCGGPKVCPGTTVGGPWPSDNYTFRNGPSGACVTVTVENDSPTVQMLATVYSDSYNPANPDKCVNYLADGGNIISSVNPIQTFSFKVSSNATFVVNIIASSTVTAPYRVTVSGGDCRPVLNITPVGANNVQLDWTTAAAGFGLESTNSLTGSGANWQPVTNVPVVINSRFLVTNNAAIGNQFYQLRKP